MSSSSTSGTTNVANLVADTLKGTPPGTPTTQAAHRAARLALQAVISDAVIAQLAAAVAAAPTVTTTTGSVPQPSGSTVTPVVGGLITINNQQVAWTGGSRLNNRLTAPASTKAYRSDDISLSLKMEKHCTAGLH